MTLFSNLPGVRINYNDGNLGVTEILDVPVTLVLGTGSSGPSKQLYPVSKSEEAANLFGDGTLARGILEARSGGAAAIVAYRIGGTAASIANIGNSTQTVGKGITVTTIECDNEAHLDIYVSWDDTAQRLKVWDEDGNLLYDNNPGGQAVDSGDVVVSGDTDGVTGDSFGTSTTGIRMDLLDEDTGTTPITGIEFTIGTDGTTPTYMELYEALQDAYRDLEAATIDVATPMEAVLDTPNIADDAALAGSSQDFLGWFKETYADGVWTYTWNTATAVKPAGYHEVNFAYQLARFCDNLSQNGKTCLGTIGTLPPADFSATTLATWVGELPTIDPFTDEVTANGSGLCGNKFMSSHTSRSMGFFRTDTEELDGTTVLDDNQKAVDIGKFLSVVAGQLRFFNNASTTDLGYITNGAACYAGLISTLDPKVSPLNQQITRVARLPFRLTKARMNDLAYANFVFFKDSPRRGIVVVDAPTAATLDSDYQDLPTVRIVNAALEAINDVAEPFLGQPMNGAIRESLKTNIERKMSTMQKNGYFGAPARFELVQTLTQAARGELDIELILVPAFSLRVVTIKVSLSKT